jgi:hypothetical protein
MSELGFKRRLPGDPKPQADLSGIPTGAIKLDERQAERAGRAGEALGFRSREPSTSPMLGRRRKVATPMKSLFIKGPAETVDWFISYADAGEFRSYWEALEDLRRRAGA